MHQKNIIFPVASIYSLKLKWKENASLQIFRPGFRPIIEYPSVATKIIFDQYLLTLHDLLHTLNISTIYFQKFKSKGKSQSFTFCKEGFRLILPSFFVTV